MLKVILIILTLQALKTQSEWDWTFDIVFDTELSWVNEELTTLKGIENFTWVTNADFSNNYLQEISDIKCLTSLFILNLGKNRIKNIDSLKELRNRFRPLSELYFNSVTKVFYGGGNATTV